MVQRFDLHQENSSQPDPPSGNEGNRGNAVGSKIGKSAGSDTPQKVLSVGGLLMSILVSLLLGLAVVVRALRNVDLSLFLNLKRDDRAEKKY